MVMRYAGKIINGQPTFLETVELPENAEITILINSAKPERKTLTSIQRETAKNVLLALENIKKEDFTKEDIESFARWDSGEFRVERKERLP
jgi:hypothetical protein